MRRLWQTQQPEAQVIVRRSMSLFGGRISKRGYMAQQHGRDTFDRRYMTLPARRWVTAQAFYTHGISHAPSWEKRLLIEGDSSSFPSSLGLYDLLF